jgi:diaminopimelate decarboxylase
LLLKILDPLQPISVIDFGGGFEPYFLDGEYASSKLASLFSSIPCTWFTAEQQGSSIIPPPLTIQFELGKAISEDAGGVLTRVLSIREHTGCSSSSDDDKDESEDEEEDEDELCVNVCKEKDGSDEKRDELSLGKKLAKNIIVDTTICDVTTPNYKSVFWIRAVSASTENVHSSPSCCTYEVVPLLAGNAQIWGRTCMEWDVIKGLFSIPHGLKEGDLLFIAGCGAYDLTMQYDFGDGIGRNKNLIVL